MMRDSYLILDEYVSVQLAQYAWDCTCKLVDINPQMRFLDCTQGRKDPSKSILDVGVANAMKFSGFDEEMFLKRGGRYTWSKGDMKLDW